MENIPAKDTSALTFTNIKASEVTPEQLKQCRDLFSTAYGVWSSKGPRPQRSVSASLQMFKEQYLFDLSTCGIVVAIDTAGYLAGQALYVKFPYLPGKEALWITQLLVREEHRHKGVACRLVDKCLMDCEQVWACGLVSSHPYAVKALQAATKRRCEKCLSMQHATGLIEQSCIPYVQGCDVFISSTKCAIQTNFHVDHALVDSIREGLPDWQLGSLDVGEEYFAFTFKEGYA